jgi:hypothetical protein
MKKFCYPLISILAVSLFCFFLLQCSIKELDDQMPYSFIEKDFQSLDIPDIQDLDMEVVEPDLPIVVESQSVFRMIQNLDEVSDPSQLNQETKSTIDRMKRIEGFSSSGIRQNMLNTVNSLKESDLGLIFFGKPELDASVSALVKTAMADAKFLDFFPKIIQPETFTVSGFIDVTIPETVLFRVNPSQGKCADAAKFALNDAIKRLEQKRDAQLVMTETNFQLRMQEADRRLAVRNLVAEQKYQNSIEASAKEVSKMLKAAKRMESKDPLLAEELRLQALAYAYAWQMIFQEEYETSLRINEMAWENEINEAKSRKQELELEIMQNFNHELDKAIATLKRVLEACHNQGKGN